MAESRLGNSDLAAELVRLRRMMREPLREELNEAATDSFKGMNH